MPSLLLGAGHSRQKKVYANGNEEWALPLVTLDMGPDSNPDVLWDLENRPLPFPDDYFDEMGAYDVLEHIGRQGDWRGFFDEFSEYHRILKPGGLFGIIVPIGNDWFADPGHTRFFTRTWFAFLSQDQIKKNLEGGRQMTDYRWFYKKNFEILHFEETGGHHLSVVLKKA